MLDRYVVSYIMAVCVLQWLLTNGSTSCVGGPWLFNYCSDHVLRGSGTFLGYPVSQNSLVMKCKMVSYRGDIRQIVFWNFRKYTKSISWGCVVWKRNARLWGNFFACCCAEPNGSSKVHCVHKHTHTHTLRQPLAETLLTLVQYS